MKPETEQRLLKKSKKLWGKKFSKNGLRKFMEKRRIPEIKPLANLGKLIHEHQKHR